MMKLRRMLGLGSAVLAWGVAQVASATAPAPAPAQGPLRIHPTNPRYFTDGTVRPDGTPRAVYLAGSHVWHNVQDHGHRLESGANPPPVFDFAAHLDLLERSGHNFTRFWRWELPRWTERDTPSKLTEYTRQQPWLRTGPERAGDGLPRFDLTRFDEDYFDRLRTRVRAAGARGIYVAVMLFELWGVTHVPTAWQSHPFAGGNNVNGIEADEDGDGAGRELHLLTGTPMGGRVRAAQESYVRRVLETLRDCDNVIYEIGNEGGTYTLPWQEHITAFIRREEAAGPQRHLVGITWMFHRDADRTPHGDNASLLRSNADWISPGNDRTLPFDPSPPAEFPGKIIVADTDHMGWRSKRDEGWFWRQFCRGNHTLYLEWSYDTPAVGAPSRAGMGQTVRWARTVNLAAMQPSTTLASTTWCLAAPGREYLVYQPTSGAAFTVELADAAATYRADWFFPGTGQTEPATEVRGGATREFTAPRAGSAVLHLHAKR